MQAADYWINHLNLQAHPEGGFYRETYRSAEKVLANELPDRFDDTRNFSTAIFFLLRSEDRSLFHRIKSDEVWHYHAGTSLSIYVLEGDALVTYVLGPNLEKGEQLQVVVPANCWFGARLNDADSYTLAGCTVSPGFDFHDFELAGRASLLQQYPAYQEIIESLTTER